MQTIKEKAIDLLSNLPNNVDWEDIQYHLYVTKKVEQGLKDVEDGKIITQEEAIEKAKCWQSLAIKK